MSDPPLTGDSSLGAVIAEFVRATDGAERRRLRAALSHVAAELGTLPIRAVRRRHLTDLLDELRDAGLTESREATIVEALRSLYAFALARRLVEVDPLPERRRRPAHRPPVVSPPRPPTAHTPLTPTPTPTLTMLALGARVAAWTAWTIMVVFAVLLIALFLELS